MDNNLQNKVTELEKLTDLIEGIHHKTPLQIYGAISGLLIGAFGIVFRHFFLALSITNICRTSIIYLCKLLEKTFPISHYGLSPSLRRKIIEPTARTLIYLIDKCKASSQLYIIIYSIIFILSFTLFLKIFTKACFGLAFIALVTFNAMQIFNDNRFFCIILENREMQYLFFGISTVIVFVMLFSVDSYLYAVVFSFIGTVLLLINVELLLEKDFGFIKLVDQVRNLVRGDDVYDFNVVGVVGGFVVGSYLVQLHIYYLYRKK